MHVAAQRLGGCVMYSTPTAREVRPLDERASQPMAGQRRRLLEHESPTPWVHNTHPKIAAIVKERK